MLNSLFLVRTSILPLSNTIKLVQIFLDLPNHPGQWYPAERANPIGGFH